MIVIEVLEAIVKLGVPVFGVSWWAIHRRYQRGDITPGANHRTVKTDLKAYRKKWRKEEKGKYGILENKWMRFGGGFYGITALTTFMLIELGEALSFLSNIADIAELFRDGFIKFVIDFLVNQLQNFISAIVWFAYWTDDDQSLFVWLVVPYAAYLLAISTASRVGRTVDEVRQDTKEEKNDEEETDSETKN